jgi:hypothetical protein
MFFLSVVWLQLLACQSSECGNHGERKDPQEWVTYG